MAHVETLGFTMADLYAAQQEGLVRRQVHPEFPNLTIWNYTEEVQFGKKWNNITLTCRGLILNEATGEVVARPWEKFFNFGERDNRIDFDGPVEVTDKMDGSLGILYRRPDGQYAIATRGSFASEQAEHATKVLYNKYPLVTAAYTGINGDSEFSKQINEWTFLFEIIYPDNRIVCNYGTMDDLVMLGAVHKERGFYIGPNVAAAMLIWTGPVTETFDYATFGDAISAKDREGAEGIVIRSGSKMVKLKQADYVELHRIVTNLSPRTVWSQLMEGKTASDICAQIPDEFHGYVERIASDLASDFADIKMTVSIEFQQIKAKLWQGEGTDISRRAWAEQIKKSTYPGLMFNRLDGKDYDEQIWKMIKPTGDAKLVNDDDA